MAQVWLSPARTIRKERPPATATGLRRSWVVPSPSWPSVFRPQQNARRSVVMPQEWSPPALTWRKRSPPRTAKGRMLQGQPLQSSGPEFVPLPSAPYSLSPQQQARSSGVTAQEWPPPVGPPPALIWRNRNVAVVAVAATTGLGSGAVGDGSCPQPRATARIIGAKRVARPHGTHLA